MDICKIDNCNKKSHAKGLCGKHYLRYKKYGDPYYTKIERHGMMEAPEYKTWKSMKERCYRLNHKFYFNYGGRGVTVCDRWKDSFILFYNDMGEMPFPKAQIDRIDNNGNYEPGNCRWVTCAENTRNRNNNVLNWFMVKSLRKLNNTHKYSRKQLCMIYNIKLCTLKDVLGNRSWVD